MVHFSLCVPLRLCASTTGRIATSFVVLMFALKEYVPPPPPPSPHSRLIPNKVYWSDNGELVAITTDQSFFILRYNKDAVTAAVESGQSVEEDGIEEAFEVLHEVGERYLPSLILLWVEKAYVNFVGYELLPGLGTASSTRTRTTD